MFLNAATSIKEHTGGAEHSGVNMTKLSSPVTVQMLMRTKSVAL